MKNKIYFIACAISIYGVCGWASSIGNGGGSGGGSILGPFASLPACGAGNSGSSYFFSNSPFINAVCDGSAWSYKTLFGMGSPAEPYDASMSDVNADPGMARTATSGVINFVCGTCNTTGAHLRVMTAPATPYTLTSLIYVQSTWEANKYTGWGLCFRESGTGELSHISINNIGSDATKTGGGQFIVEDWTNPTTPGANKITLPTTSGGVENWILLRIADDGTDRIYSWSKDGVVWQVVYQIGRTNFLTADQIGIMTATSTSSAQRWSATWVTWTIQ